MLPKRFLLRYIEYIEYQIIENIENSLFSRHFKKIYGLNEIFFGSKAIMCYTIVFLK